MAERKILRSRAHVQIMKGVSVSLPLDEIFDAVAAIGRRALVAIKHPRATGKVKARIAEAEMDRFAEHERDRILRDTEKTLTGLGYPKKQARAAVDQIRDRSLGKASHEIVAMALRVARPPEGTETIEATCVEESGQARKPS